MNQPTADELRRNVDACAFRSLKTWLSTGEASLVLEISPDADFGEVGMVLVTGDRDAARRLYEEGKTLYICAARDYALPDDRKIEALFVPPIYVVKPHNTNWR